ncbi:MAG TPA: hypothetical protein VGO93_13110, partial [Candidatus Xenobia bacterium]
MRGAAGNRRPYRDNPALRRVIGLEEGQGIPDAWNMSRFLEVLGQPQHLALIEAIFGQLVGRLGQVVGDLGRDVAGDSAALCGRPGKSPDDAAGGEPEGAEPAGTPLPQPAGGKKEYEDDAGKVTKVYEWFGYKFHLLVDVKHEVVVSWHVTSAAGEGSGDSSVLPTLLGMAGRVLPPGRMKTLAYDKAAARLSPSTALGAGSPKSDDEKTHELLNGQQVRPLIQVRSMWKGKGEPESFDPEALDGRLLPGHDGNSNVV